jgi:DNA-binding NarL/FixJ family response regulator
MTQALSKPIRLVIVEDQELLRVAIKTILSNTGCIQVVADTPSGNAILQSAQDWKPDVVLMDIFLGDGNGFNICRKVREACPHARFLFFSAFCDQTVIQGAIRAGASGFLDKTTSMVHLVDAIQAVAAGNSYFGGQAMELLSQVLQPSSSHSEHSPMAYLSPQESQVITLVAEGNTDKEIAASLHLSKTAVRLCLSDAFHKLQVRSRSQAVAMYWKGRRTLKQ